MLVAGIGEDANLTDKALIEPIKMSGGTLQAKDLVRSVKFSLAVGEDETERTLISCTTNQLPSILRCMCTTDAPSWFRITYRWSPSSQRRNLYWVALHMRGLGSTRRKLLQQQRIVCTETCIHPTNSRNQFSNSRFSSFFPICGIHRRWGWPDYPQKGMVWSQGNIYTTWLYFSVQTTNLHLHGSQKSITCFVSFAGWSFAQPPWSHEVDLMVHTSVASKLKLNPSMESKMWCSTSWKVGSAGTEDTERQ